MWIIVPPSCFRISLAVSLTACGTSVLLIIFVFKEVGGFYFPAAVISRIVLSHVHLSSCFIPLSFYLTPPNFAPLAYVWVLLCDFVRPECVDGHPKFVGGESLVDRGYRAKVVMPSTIRKVVYRVAMCHIHNTKIRIFL